MASLLEQYRKQWGWRDWENLFTQLPNISNKKIYDFGCAHGDHTEALSNLGAKVHGVDANQDFVNFASNRNIPNSQFSVANLNKIPDDFLKCDGIWTSFVMAYFTDLENILNKWKVFLNPNGWIAITEMTGLFNHLPAYDSYADKINEFYNNSIDKKNYDFESASRVENALRNTGFQVVKKYLVMDKELSFNGPASSDIIKAWEERLDRMGGFKQFMGESYDHFKKDFISTLKRDDHVSNCKVYFFLGKLTS
jgi:SAM-dependent methyltransferase